MKKGISKKFVLGSFNICKDTFFSIWTKEQPKNCARFFQDFQVYFFDSLEKGTSIELFEDFLKFVSIIFFNIWERGQAKKLV